MTLLVIKRQQGILNAPVQISVNLCNAVDYNHESQSSIQIKQNKPEERLISLEMSLLHLRIEAKSAALKVDS